MIKQRFFIKISVKCVKTLSIGLWLYTTVQNIMPQYWDCWTERRNRYSMPLFLMKQEAAATKRKCVKSANKQGNVHRSKNELQSKRANNVRAEPQGIRRCLKLLIVLCARQNKQKYFRRY